ncbi:unnamed protein product [Victoria cruziana]
METADVSGFCASTGVYYSQWKTPAFPRNLLHSFPSFLFSLHQKSAGPAFVDAKTGTKIMYSELRSLTNMIASSLHSLGINQDDVVLIISPNFLYYPLLILAIMSLGAVVSPINPLCLRDEVESQTKDSKPKLIFTTQELEPKYHGLLAKPLILLEPFMEQLLQGPPADTISKPPPGAAIKQGDTAMLAYSSGTTGKSKGVMCSHGNLIAMACMLRSVWSSKHAGDEVFLCMLPLFHMYGLSVFVIGGLSAGICTVIAQKYVLVDMLDWVEKYRVTRLPAVPLMMIQLLRSPAARTYRLSSLREVASSGASLTREFMVRFTKLYPHVVLTQCYGLTETCGPVTLCDGVEGRFHLSVGRLGPSVEARIVDVSTGEWLTPGRCGELRLRGPMTTQGYFKNQEATAQARDEEGWLRTGDVCRIDKCGLVYIVGRIKELIKYKAYQVSPVELEEILSNHEAVEDCAVIPYPDEEAGEIPTACIVKKALTNLREEDVILYMADKVSPYKKIRKVVFVDQIPRSPSGKILRRLVMALAFPQPPEVTSRL